MFRQAHPRLSSRALRRRRARLTARGTVTRVTTPFLLFAMAVGLGFRAYAATPDNWQGPASGNIEWSTSSNWSGGIPVSTNDAVNTTGNPIDYNTNEPAVNSFTGNGIFTLTGGTLSGALANSASLFQNNNSFTVNGGGLNNLTYNPGTGSQGLTFSSSTSNSLTNVIVNSSASLGTGGFVRLFNGNTFNGAVTMGSGSNIILNDGNASLTVGSTGTLSGQGLVDQGNSNANVVNNGTVNANVSGQALTFQPVSGSNFSVNNNGTAEATGGGLLTFTNDNVTNGATGIIQATGTGSTVTFTGGTAVTAAKGSQFLTSGGGTVLFDNAGMSGEAKSAALNFSTSTGNSLSSFTLDSGSLNVGTGFVRLFNAVNVGTASGTGSLTLGAGGNVILNDGNAALTIASGSTLSGQGLVDQGNSNAVVTNNGTVNANVSAATLTFQPVNGGNFQFKNNATAEATGGGLLTFTGVNVTNAATGTFLASGSGSTVTFTGGTAVTAAAGSSFQTSGGTVLFDNAALNGETSGNITFSGSTGNSLGNSFLSTSSFTLDSGSVTLQPAGFVRLFNVNTFNGAVTMVGAGANNILLSDGNATFNINVGLSGQGLVDQGNSNALVTNNSTVNANVSGQTLNFQPVNGGNFQFKNNGTAEATNGGALTFTGVNVTNAATGIFQAGNASTTGAVTFNGGTQVTAAKGSSFQNPNGTVLFDNAALNGETAGNITFSTSSGNSLGNSFLSTSTFTQDAGTVALGTGGFVQLYNGNTFNGAVTMGSGSNIILHDGNASLNLTSTGTLSGQGTVNQGNSNAVVNNGGLVNANVNGQTLLFTPTNGSNFQFKNNGTAEATNGGALTFTTDNVTNAATGLFLASGAGSAVTFNGGSAVTAVKGSQFQTSGGTVLFDNAALNGETSGNITFSTSSGNNLSSFTQDSGTIALQPAGFVRLVGTDTFDGAVTMTGAGANNILLNDGNASLTLGSTGSLTGQGLVDQGNSNAVVNNGGTVDANGGTLTFNAVNGSNFQYNNQSTGHTNVESGAALSVTGANTDSGSMLVKTNGTATFNQGLTQTGTGTTQIDGTLNLGGNAFNLQGGTLEGTGTVNAAVNNTGGTVKGGDSPGTLTLAGSYTQSSGAILLDQLTGFTPGTDDLLNVTSGTVTINPGSILDVSLINGFMPFSGNANIGTTKIPFLDYVTLNSNFLLSDYTVNSLNTGYSYTIGNDTTNKDLYLTMTAAPNAPPPPPPAVPEPSTFALLGFGGLALIGVARRRRTSV